MDGMRGSIVAKCFSQIKAMLQIGYRAHTKEK